MRHCPICNAQYESGKFCLDCGEPLVEDVPAAGAGMSLNLGDANAISGGVHLSDSHNVSNVDQRVINTSTVSNVTNNITQLERQKTENEILQERKIQFMELCKQVYADGILEEWEKAELEMKRIELNLDTSIAAQLIESARRSMSNRMTALTVKDSVTMKLITKLVHENKADLVKAQLPRLEAMAKMYQVDEVLYKYNLLLAAMNPEKLIRQYEGEPTDEYWQTYWVCLAYLKNGDVEKFEEASLRLNLYPNYSENNDLILQAISIRHDFGADSDTVREMMSIMDVGSCSPELKGVIHALYLVADPEKAKEVNADRKACAFLMENIVSLESAEARAERMAKEKADAEAKAKAAAEAAARAKVEQEEALRKQVTYSVKINKVDNQLLAMMTARTTLGWTSVVSRTNFAKLPMAVKSSENKAEIEAFAEKLSKGGLTVEVAAVNGMNEVVLASVKAEEREQDWLKKGNECFDKKRQKKKASKTSSKIVANDETIFDIVKKEIKCLGLDADLNHIDVSGCTTFFDGEGGLFEETDFHGDISKWDVSNVTNMKYLFRNCKDFNCDISGWDVSSVEDMSAMFAGCGKFDQDLSDWDVSNVRHVSNYADDVQCWHGMFDDCVSFRGRGLQNWDVSNIENMNFMFYNCKNFNQDLSDWDVSNVTDMKYMFYYCERFEGTGLDDWDVSNVVTMEGMFSCCSNLNDCDLSEWDMSHAEDTSSMFFDCENFNCDLSKWDMSNVKVCRKMFEWCENFNCDISKWDVSKVENMEFMFSGCKKFDNDLSGWDVSNVTSMRRMFEDCVKFEGTGLDDWDVSSVEDMAAMFKGCKKLNDCDLSGWDVSSVEDYDDIFEDCSLDEDCRPDFD